MSVPSTYGAAHPTERQRRFVGWTADVLMYIVVLNLFVEYADAVVIDSFTISIFTAVVLKALLDVILTFEHGVRTFFFDRGQKVVGVAAVWAILFGSKFVILEVIDVIFGDHVELGHLVEVILLVVALMAARQILQRVYVALGDPAPDGH